jgi:hypothetical protein
VQKQPLLKFLIPAFYLVAMALVVFNAWNEQRTVRQGSGSPLYRNLYVERRIIDKSRPTMLGDDIPGTEVVVNTYYCFSEDVLKEHRKGRIDVNSSVDLSKSEQNQSRKMLLLKFFK